MFILGEVGSGIWQNQLPRKSYDLINSIYLFIGDASCASFGTSVRRSSGHRSDGRLLANDIVATIFISLFLFFSFFPPVVCFSHRRSAPIKKLV